MSRLAARYSRYRILLIAPAACLGLWAGSVADVATAQQPSPGEAISAATDGVADATSGFRVGKRSATTPEFKPDESSVVMASGVEDDTNGVRVDQRVFAESELRTASFAALQPRLGGPSAGAVSPATPATKRAVRKPTRHKLLRPIATNKKPNPLEPVATAGVTPVATAQTKPVAAQTTPRGKTVTKRLVVAASAKETVSKISTGTVLGGMESIVIRPPFVQPYYPDRYTFMVENTGDEDIAEFNVTLTADAAVAIIETSPERSRSSDAHVAEITIDQLNAGKSQMIDIQVAQESNDAVAFTATLSRVEIVKVDFQVPAGGSNSRPMPQLQDERSVFADAEKIENVDQNAPLTDVATVGEQPLKKSFPKTKALPVGYAIATSLVNPISVTRGAESQYGIEVKNGASRKAVDVIVQLKIPVGLQVTVLDRNAWMDAENRTVTWKIDSMEPGAMDYIQYKAVANTIGAKAQTVTVGMENVFQGRMASTTEVIAERLANHNGGGRVVR